MPSMRNTLRDGRRTSENLTNEIKMQKGKSYDQNSQRKSTRSKSKYSTQSRSPNKRKSRNSKRYSRSPSRKEARGTSKRKSHSPSRKESRSYSKRESRNVSKRESRNHSRRQSRSPSKRQRSASRRETRSPSRRETRSPSRRESRREPRSPPQRESRSPSRMESISQSGMDLRSPSNRESRSPSNGETRSPSRIESRSPSRRESRSPSTRDSRSPSRRDSRSPSRRDSRSPSRRESRSPSRMDSRSPSRMDSRNPSRMDSRNPSRMDLRNPSTMDSRNPSKMDSRNPSKMDSRNPSRMDSKNPSRMDSRNPSRRESRSPSRKDLSGPNEKQSKMSIQWQPEDNPNLNTSQSIENKKSEPNLEPSSELETIRDSGLETQGMQPNESSVASRSVTGSGVPKENSSTLTASASKSVPSSSLAPEASASAVEKQQSSQRPPIIIPASDQPQIIEIIPSKSCECPEDKFIQNESPKPPSACQTLAPVCQIAPRCSTSCYFPPTSQPAAVRNFQAGCPARRQTRQNIPGSMSQPMMSGSMHQKTKYCSSLGASLQQRPSVLPSTTWGQNMPASNSKVHTTITVFQQASENPNIDPSFIATKSESPSKSAFVKTEHKSFADAGTETDARRKKSKRNLVSSDNSTSKETRQGEHRSRSEKHRHVTKRSESETATEGVTDTSASSETIKTTSAPSSTAHSSAISSSAVSSAPSVRVKPVPQYPWWKPPYMQPPWGYAPQYQNPPAPRSVRWNGHPQSMYRQTTYQYEPSICPMDWNSNIQTQGSNIPPPEPQFNPPEVIWMVPSEPPPRDPRPFLQRNNPMTPRIYVYPSRAPLSYPQNRDLYTPTIEYDPVRDHPNTRLDAMPDLYRASSWPQVLGPYEKSPRIRDFPKPRVTFAPTLNQYLSSIPGLEGVASWPHIADKNFGTEDPNGFGMTQDQLIMAQEEESENHPLDSHMPLEMESARMVIGSRNEYQSRGSQTGESFIDWSIVDEEYSIPTPADDAPILTRCPVQRMPEISSSITQPRNIAYIENRKMIQMNHIRRANMQVSQNEFVETPRLMHVATNNQQMKYSRGTSTPENINQGLYTEAQPKPAYVPVKCVQPQNHRNYSNVCRVRKNMNRKCKPCPTSFPWVVNRNPQVMMISSITKPYSQSTEPQQIRDRQNKNEAQMNKNVLGSHSSRISNLKTDTIRVPKTQYSFTNSQTKDTYPVDISDNVSPISEAENKCIAPAKPISEHRTQLEKERTNFFFERYQQLSGTTPEFTQNSKYLKPKSNDSLLQYPNTTSMVYQYLYPQDSNMNQSISKNNKPIMNSQLSNIPQEMTFLSQNPEYSHIRNSDMVNQFPNISDERNIISMSQQFGIPNNRNSAMNQHSTVQSISNERMMYKQSDAHQGSHIDKSYQRLVVQNQNQDLHQKETLSKHKYSKMSQAQISSMFNDILNDSKCTNAEILPNKSHRKRKVDTGLVSGGMESSFRPSKKSPRFTGSSRKKDSDRMLKTKDSSRSSRSKQSESFSKGSHNQTSGMFDKRQLIPQKIPTRQPPSCVNISACGSSSVQEDQLYDKDPMSSTVRNEKRRNKYEDNLNYSLNPVTRSSAKTLDRYDPGIWLQEGPFTSGNTMNDSFRSQQNVFGSSTLSDVSTRPDISYALRNDSQNAYYNTSSMASTVGPTTSHEQRNTSRISEASFNDSYAMQQSNGLQNPPEALQMSGYSYETPQASKSSKGLHIKFASGTSDKGSPQRGTTFLNQQMMNGVSSRLSDMQSIPSINRTLYAGHTPYPSVVGGSTIYSNRPQETNFSGLSGMISGASQIPGGPSYYRSLYAGHMPYASAVTGGNSMFNNNRLQDANFDRKLPNILSGANNIQGRPDLSMYTGIPQTNSVLYHSVPGGTPIFNNNQPHGTSFGRPQMFGGMPILHNDMTQFQGRPDFPLNATIPTSVSYNPVSGTNPVMLNSYPTREEYFVKPQMIHGLSYAPFSLTQLRGRPGLQMYSGLAPANSTPYQTISGVNPMIYNRNIGQYQETYLPSQTPSTSFPLQREMYTNIPSGPAGPPAFSSVPDIPFGTNTNQFLTRNFPISSNLSGRIFPTQYNGPNRFYYLPYDRQQHSRDIYRLDQTIPNNPCNLYAYPDHQYESTKKPKRSKKPKSKKNAKSQNDYHHSESILQNAMHFSEHNADVNVHKIPQRPTTWSHGRLSLPVHQRNKKKINQQQDVESQVNERKNKSVKPDFCLTSYVEDSTGNPPQMYVQEEYHNSITPKPQKQEQNTNYPEYKYVNQIIPSEASIQKQFYIQQGCSELVWCKPMEQECNIMSDLPSQLPADANAQNHGLKWRESDIKERPETFSGSNPHTSSTEWPVSRSRSSKCQIRWVSPQQTIGTSDTSGLSQDMKLQWSQNVIQGKEQTRKRIPIARSDSSVRTRNKYLSQEICNRENTNKVKSASSAMKRTKCSLSDPSTVTSNTLNEIRNPMDKISDTVCSNTGSAVSSIANWCEVETREMPPVTTSEPVMSPSLSRNVFLEQIQSCPVASNNFQAADNVSPPHLSARQFSSRKVLKNEYQPPAQAVAGTSSQNDGGSTLDGEETGQNGQAPPPTPTESTSRDTSLTKKMKYLTRPPEQPIPAVASPNEQAITPPEVPSETVVRISKEFGHRSATEIPHESTLASNTQSQTPFDRTSRYSVRSKSLPRSRVALRKSSTARKVCSENLLRPW